MNSELHVFGELNTRCLCYGFLFGCIGLNMLVYPCDLLQSVVGHPYTKDSSTI